MGDMDTVYSAISKTHAFNMGTVYSATRCLDQKSRLSKYFQYTLPYYNIDIIDGCRLSTNCDNDEQKVGVNDFSLNTVLNVVPQWIGESEGR